MRQRSKHVIVFDQNSDRAATLQMLAASDRRITVDGTIVSVLEALGRDELVVAIIDYRDNHLRELVALASINALTKSVEVIVSACCNAEVRNAREISDKHGLGEVVDLSDINAAIAAVELREEKLLAAEGILRIGCTRLYCRENTIRASNNELRVQPSTSALLEALMRAYPEAVSHAALHTGVVRFAPDAQSGAVHTRIYQVRRALREVNADIEIEFVEGHGYRVAGHHEGGTR